MEKSRRKNRTLFIGVWPAFVGLAFLFPYTGDDWMWGTTGGLELLKSGFVGYNGRYFGNIIVLMLTRSKILQTVVVSGTMFLMAYLLYRMVDGERMLIFLLAAVSMLMLPRTMMRETFVWVSGFSNYATSTVLLLLFLNILKYLQDESVTTKRIHVYLCAATGFASALFVENMTLACMVFGGIASIYIYIIENYLKLL